MLTSSIIICTKDRLGRMETCLESLFSQSHPPTEIIVVDSGVETAELLLRNYQYRLPKISLRYTTSEPGLTRQRNLGIRLASCDILHFLDDDVILERDYVAAIQKTFEGRRATDVVGVSPMLIEPDELSALGVFIRRLFLLPHAKSTGRLLPSGFGAYPWNGDEANVREIHIACGCCAYRRSLFDKITFDEFFSGYGYMEDLDFSLQAGKQGRILLNPKAVVFHAPAESGRPNLRRMAAMQTINHYYVFRKHLSGSPWRWACFYWSEFGDGLLKLLQGLRRGNWDLFLGWLDGHRGKSEV